jgi:hypothetical protein
MHYHVLPREPGPQLADIGRRLAHRAQTITAPSWRARHRPPRPWVVGLEADPLNPGRAPEESYRDYMFRKAI